MKTAPNPSTVFSEIRIGYEIVAQFQREQIEIIATRTFCAARQNIATIRARADVVCTVFASLAKIAISSSRGLSTHGGCAGLSVRRQKH